MELSDKDIIRKYINGNCTEQEMLRVRSIMESPRYRQLMEELLSEDGNPIQPGITETTPPQMQDWLDKIDRRIAQSQHRAEQKNSQRPFYLRYAAVWLLMTIGAGMFGIHYYNKQKQQAVSIVWMEKYNPKGKRIQITLSDSTVITLAADSRLRFPERFTDTTRTVFLEGEAFFEVAHNPSKPFIVHTADLQTRVLGTSFRISSFKNAATTVSVATGRVSVDQISESSRQSLAILRPGQQLHYADGQAQMLSVSVDDLQGWKEGQLVYTASPLGEITDELGRWYNKNITYSRPATANIPMDINLDTHISIDRVMKILAASGGFTYKIKQDTIIIY
ncbi:FecR family protein [Sphingobacterium hotanense]|uniref:FecR family protein n=1 Tax=Sphingobacterium hotanense TaxID=649196 RepID=UPI0021A908C7|nr:FecR family protein [Sphingobacterium hotanense]MCT1523852.1 FecR domain-containing protein [Sphingobacterium hotanense]